MSHAELRDEPVVHGRYFDGRTARAREALARLNGNGSLWLQPVDTPAGWTIEAENIRITPRLAGVPRRLELPGGAFIETRDDDSVDLWCRQSRGRRATGLLSRVEANWSLAVAALVIVAALLWGGYRYGVPLIAQPIAAAVPEYVLDQIGESTFSTLEQGFFQPTATDAMARSQLHRSLAELQPPVAINLQFRRIGDMANAMALPDGTVVFTDRLMDELTLEEQRAVLAHEIAHVHLRHSMQMIVRISALPAMLAFISGDLSQILTAGGALPALLIQQSYSRQMEREADIYAVELLAARGLDPLAMATALERLEALHGDESQDEAGTASWLSSHPETAQRIAEIEARADQL